MTGKFLSKNKIFCKNINKYYETFLNVLQFQVLGKTNKIKSI